MKHTLTTLKDFKSLIGDSKYFEIKVYDSVSTPEKDYDIYSVSIGSKDKSAPTLALTGGVHGLERIGTQVLLNYLVTLKERLVWDQDLQAELKDRRIVCLPVINPWGIDHHRRSNHNGVDLMRNAPIEAENATYLVGGHHISSKLPWYRGIKNEPMEKESNILMNFLKEEVFPARVSIALDFHSGFGIKDQIWYPYAKSKESFPFLNQFKNLDKLFQKTYPHHVYNIEPQSKHYTTHGDLWDYSLKLHQESEYKNQTYIPLTLELGSWLWARKNPIQLFSILGLFHPIKPHRYSRVMRRHIYFLDFLHKALKNDQAWNYFR